ncbi:histidine phosphatase family protein [Saccharothrix violaceirubra]|uniref:Broad specificity phosphatase PhoE n=1 Tax=Saccharothrix violaceirubra TaxID=413306 RepID=A0A7W7T6M3_9PSEU|nr:histidine phosphatase family protein [Saccharothrix violaceirubra]MBB4967539.1 broad specificity phosphatase PhoE [Saccharothrix violaceirubra]
MRVDFGWIGLIRHAESTANVVGARAEADGSETIDLPERDADVPLSDRGLEQASALGRWFGAQPRAQWPDVVVCSPYRRAIDTARLALPEHPLTIVDERVRDRELGVLDLLTRHGVARRFPDEVVRERRLGKFYHRPPGGESWADVALRLRSLLGDLDRRFPGRRLLLVGHEVTALLLRYLLECVPERDLLAYARNRIVPNASLTSWTPAGDRYALEHEHATAHLST